MSDQGGYGYQGNQNWQPAPYGQPDPYGRRPTNTLAVLALVFAFLIAPLGIVFGHIARGQIKRTGEEGDGTRPCRTDHRLHLHRTRHPGRDRVDRVLRGCSPPLSATPPMKRVRGVSPIRRRTRTPRPRLGRRVHPPQRRKRRRPHASQPRSDQRRPSRAPTVRVSSPAAPAATPPILPSPSPSRPDHESSSAKPESGVTTTRVNG